MTMCVALAALLLVVGIIGAIVKRMFRLAAAFAVVTLLLLGVAIYVIANMR